MNIGHREKCSQGVAAIILNRNAWPDTVRCVDSLMESFYPIKLVVIVDNGSIDNSIERMIKEFPRKIGSGPFRKDIVNSGCDFSIYEGQGRPRMAIISIPFNTGVGGGRNIGLERALLDKEINYFFIIDNDAEIIRETIAVCLETAETAGAALIGCLIKSYDGSLQFSGQKFWQNLFYIDILLKITLYKNHLRFWDADMVTGCASLVSRSALEGLKKRDGYLIDSSFFLYAEDQDFSLRIKRMGYKIVIAKEAVVFHKISRGGAGKAIAYYYSSRNRLLLAQQHLPRWLKFIFFVFFPLTRLFRFYYHMMRGSKQMAAAHLEGLKDGFLGVRGRWKKHY